ncbi:ABC transporter permease [Microbispora siamensis]|uniref:ABC transporter permease n=1 Tax=Microbispora siamensis TaxID=564413 RepID=A0ABQ4GNJ6_9ACTN|nr:ABC transporter permease [Microbispora siamensis]GIH62958.1 ABC transporter permease [Microbispora siamensis]
MTDPVTPLTPGTAQPPADDPADGLAASAAPGTARTRPGRASSSGARRVHRPAGQGARSSVLPGTLFLLALVGAPLVIVVAYSFMSRGMFGVGVAGPFSVDSYVRLLFDTQLDGSKIFDPRYIGVFWQSIWLAALTTVCCAVLAFPMAVWMATRSPRTRALLVFAVTIPFWTNTLVRTYAWVLILNDNGPVSGLLGTPIGLLYTPFATAVGLVYVSLPFMILPVYSSAEKFDFRLAEAAYDLGARRLTILRRVVYPAVRPGLVAGVVLVFIPSLGAFLQPQLLGGGKSLMIGNLIEQQFGASRNWPLGSAVAVALLVLTLLTLMGFALAGRRGGQKVSLM